MVTFARQPFWLDGGYDRDCVEACKYHPEHRWWPFRLGEVIHPDNVSDPNKMMVICKGCYVPRCGKADELKPCLEPRHHTGEHRYTQLRERNAA